MSRPLPVLLGGLFLSGAAGLVNQVAWQRGLKVFLGGSEALSAMTVVLVFMLGLGIGAGAFAARASRVRSPLRLLGVVELLLCGATIGVGLLLSRDLSESVYAVQRAAVGSGVPLRLLYVVGALLVLGVPCFLMGTTLPLSSEACQRQLGHDGGTQGARVVNRLLFVNTAGAVGGAIVSGFVLLPALGQAATIGIAAALNGAAGVLFIGISGRVAAESSAGLAPTGRSLAPTPDDRLGFAMGLLSLGYEMYLFRAMALVHEPLPYTFTAVLCGFLAAWSVGAWLASRTSPAHVSRAIGLSAVGVALLPVVLELDRWVVQAPLLVGVAVACLPVVGFGLAYGGLVRRSARSWGRDVGRFGAWNTIGSCAGILGGTLLGYELAPPAFAFALAAGLFATWLHAHGGISRTVRWGSVAGTLAFVAYAHARPPPPLGPLVAAFYDRDGAVEIDAAGNLIWDGLWHSRLARIGATGGDHVGTSNWLLAAMPALVHTGPVEDALVVGVGAGITVGTLARIGTVRQVDAYDLNGGLREILTTYAAATLNVATDPRVNLLWQDGRSGLALRPKVYDLITQQPLYLRQAGSSLLLSQEYFRLVQRRLRPGGVLAIYANAHGVEAQAHLVRETAASVFAHCVTIDSGYGILASDAPIVATEATFRARMAQGDPLGDEMAGYDAAARAAGERSLFDRLDGVFTPTPGARVIRDDHPLVEYPGWATRLAPGRSVRVSAAE
ncbi:MAG: hypothetical protein Q8P18_06320 [Pseudomonadota bacterium]|nr:hypothetical protein [Pseudomonadota bacterium]